MSENEKPTPESISPQGEWSSTPQVNSPDVSHLHDAGADWMPEEHRVQILARFGSADLERTASEVEDLLGRVYARREERGIAGEGIDPLSSLPPERRAGHFAEEWGELARRNPDSLFNRTGVVGIEIAVTKRRDSLPPRYFTP